MWEYFRSWREFAREMAIRASIAERHNDPVGASKLLSLVDKVREFDKRYYDELNIRLGYILYTFQDRWGRKPVEHYSVKAIVLRADGPDPEIDFVDVEWWLKEQEAT